MNCLHLLEWADGYLAEHGVRSWRLEGELLLSAVLECDRTDLYLDKEPIRRCQTEHFMRLINERIEGRPIQYLCGKTEFMGLEFMVNENTFIPRPETEILVEHILELASGKNHELSILDIGTGCGNIAISLAKCLKNCKIVASDISKEALKVGRINAVYLGVAFKVEFVESDLFDGLAAGMRFDIIVTNPPYIAEEDLANLSSSVRREPRIALNGGAGGLGFYRRLVKGAAYYLKEGGTLAMEIGFGESDGVKKYLDDAKAFKNIRVIKDYSNIERIIIAEYGQVSN